MTKLRLPFHENLLQLVAIPYPTTTTTTISKDTPAIRATFSTIATSIAYVDAEPTYHHFSPDAEPGAARVFYL
ncbi:unnamed protein product [Dibothriocephalus latus]|uniref:Uncharacterized protein n=1 Tax=Dibothriocephalus latus TaxID=60516 RepID=A0A3P7LT82_DIBLA|nr:unnamed protein product [Dibothriocephalus latus]